MGWGKKALLGRVLTSSPMALRPHQAFVDEVREIEAADPEEFDRVGFALDVAGALRGARLTVAVYSRRAGLRVDAVRDLRGGEGARWVMLGVPPRASRAQIAYALADVAGVTKVPYILDVLLRAGQREERLAHVA
jgi:hypothetical protein